MLKKLYLATAFTILGALFAAPSFSEHLNNSDAEDGCGGQILHGWAQGCIGEETQTGITLYYDIMVDAEGNVLPPTHEDFVPGDWGLGFFNLRKEQDGPLQDAGQPFLHTCDHPGADAATCGRTPDMEAFVEAPATTLFGLWALSIINVEQEETAAPTSQDNRACAGIPLSLRYVLCPSKI